MSGSGSGGVKASGGHGRGSAGAKLVDESHMKCLRELGSLPGNRNCFECNTRGTNYVDVTVGSFICMTCSGLLRGITPPHRVKSISMATFSPDEIQLLKSRGNEYCRKVWLATYTARDATLTSSSSSTTSTKASSTESESDRRATLKSHMSAKYEQKRYWVDPSTIPDLADVAMKANTTTPNSTPTSTSSSGGSSSHSNRSPSLSSASSGSSLSQAQHTSGGLNGTPSPILNNLRNNNSLSLNHPCPGSTGTSSSTPNRLVSSATLPDIKPLTSLFNGGGGGSIPAPFNFINNLSSNHHPNQQQQQNDDKIINTNPHPLQQMPKDPWGNGDSAPTNGFNANFANFDEAFSSGNGNFDAFSNGNGHNLMKRDVNQQNQGGGVGIGDGGFAIFDKPLVPLTQNGVAHGHGHSTTGINNDLNGHGHGHPLCPGDRYAALKDLDELFKHGDTVVAHNTNPHSSSNGGGVNGLSSSASVPANLSSSLGSSTYTGNGSGWPSTTHGPNNHNNHSVPNPFSMFGTSPNTNTNGWGGGGGPTNSNPHNPFAATVPAAPSSTPPTWPSPSPFGASQGPNNIFQSQQQQQQSQSQLFQFGGNTGSKGGNSGPIFNPFASPATAANGPSNPHNPFL